METPTGNQIIAGVTGALAGRVFATEGAMWDAVAASFGEVAGRPLDRVDPYDLMLAYAVTTKLSVPTLAPDCT